MRRHSPTLAASPRPSVADWGEECTEILKDPFDGPGKLGSPPPPTVRIRPPVASEAAPSPAPTPAPVARRRQVRRGALRFLSMVGTAAALTGVYFGVPVEELSLAFERAPTELAAEVPSAPTGYQVSLTPAVLVAPTVVLHAKPPPPPVPPRTGGAGKVRWAKADAAAKALIWPVDNAIITSRFGARVDPLNGTADGMHRGVDVGCPNGTPILAAADGKVVLARRTPTGGLTLRIEHEDKRLFTLYAHLSKLQVKVGDEVKAGQQIGKSGQTGRVTGPHLHFEVWTQRRALNPLALRYRPAAPPAAPAQANPEMLAVAAPPLP